jgi:hypothetical protein
VLHIRIVPPTRGEPTLSVSCTDPALERYRATQRAAFGGMTVRSSEMIAEAVTTIAEAVESVLQVTESALTRSPHDPISSTPSSVRVLLAAGEDVVAYEILCDNLYEVDVRPPADLARDLRRAVVEAGADPSRADLLLR